jgi:hypothetical protein
VLRWQAAHCAACGSEPSADQHPRAGRSRLRGQQGRAAASPSTVREAGAAPRRAHQARRGAHRSRSCHRREHHRERDERRAGGEVESSALSPSCCGRSCSPIVDTVDHTRRQPSEDGWRMIFRVAGLESLNPRHDGNQPVPPTANPSRRCQVFRTTSLQTTSGKGRLLPSESEGFHDSQRGEGVVSGVEKLSLSEVRGSPVASCDALRFPETLVEHRTDGRADADLALKTAFSEVLVEIDNRAERNVQGTSNLSPLISQSEANFQHTL